MSGFSWPFLHNFLACGHVFHRTGVHYPICTVIITKIFNEKRNVAKNWAWSFIWSFVLVWVWVSVDCIIRHRTDSSSKNSPRKTFESNTIGILEHTGCLLPSTFPLPDIPSLCDFLLFLFSFLHLSWNISLSLCVFSCHKWSRYSLFLFFSCLFLESFLVSNLWCQQCISNACP